MTWHILGFKILEVLHSGQPQTRLISFAASFVGWRLSTTRPACKGK